MHKFEFVLTGDQTMHCSGCEARVTYALRQVPGVREVRPDAGTQHVVVVVDSEAGTAREAIADKLRQLGYTPQTFAGA